MSENPENPEISYSRLKWMCRRGMKELDVLVTRFLDTRYAAAPPALREAFVDLLQRAEDPDIWAWVMGYETPPAQYADIIEALVGTR